MEMQIVSTDSSTEMLDHISADCDMSEPAGNNFLPESLQPRFLVMNAGLNAELSDSLS